MSDGAEKLESPGLLDRHERLGLGAWINSSCAVCMYQWIHMYSKTHGSPGPIWTDSQQAAYALAACHARGVDVRERWTYGGGWMDGTSAFCIVTRATWRISDQACVQVRSRCSATTGCLPLIKRVVRKGKPLLLAYPSSPFTYGLYCTVPMYKQASFTL